MIVVSLVSVLPDLAALRTHEARPRPARRRRQPGRGATDRRARADDARGRLGARGSARRRRRRARRAVALPRAEHDADGAAVRLRGGGARRDGLADRRGVGGLVLGVLLNLVGTYVHWVGGELRLAVALAVILGVLLVRPGRAVRPRGGETRMRVKLIAFGRRRARADRAAVPALGLPTPCSSRPSARTSSRSSGSTS